MILNIAPTPESIPVALLVERVLALAAGSDRVILGITGSPGSGKTTLAQHLVRALNGAGRSTRAVSVPMDGFHLANATLDRLGIHDRKGAIETFDGWGFLSLLERLRAERDHAVYAPSFRRTVDEGVAGEITIGPEVQIVVTEGNYLLVDQKPWNHIPRLLDEIWFCETPEDERLARLVHRHIRYGRSEADALVWASSVDAANAELIESTRSRSDLVLSPVAIP